MSGFFDWTVGGDGHYVVPVSDKYEKIVAVVVSAELSESERYVRAHLMAAAPDLLAALRGVVDVADRATTEFDAAHAAIAKAEGRA